MSDKTPAQIVIETGPLQGYEIDGTVASKSFCPPEHLSLIKNLQLHPDDVIVSGFPKSGNTWLLTIVSAILSSDLDQFEEDGTPGPRMVFEIVHIWDENKTIPHPAAYMTHLRYHMLPPGVRDNQNKLIYITRNPKDVAVSIFHYFKIISKLHFDAEAAEKMTFDDFLKNIFFNKLVPHYGNWFEHTKSWLQHKNDGNILFISYEELIKDTSNIISKIASFLEKDISTEKLQHIVRMVSFDSMRENPKMDIKQALIVDPKKGRFIRKGIIGDWKNHFTEDQNKAFDALYEEFVSETGFRHVFE